MREATIEIIEPTEIPEEVMMRIERRPDDRVVLVRDGEEPTPVQIRRPFPWSAPDSFISLCDEKDHEVALVVSLDELDADSREILEQSLAPARFVLDVKHVRSIETELEIRLWDVETEQGAYVFQTKHDDWPLVLEDGSLLIRDIDGDLFRVTDMDKMDERSRRLLWAFVD